MRRRPSDSDIRTFIDGQASQPFSYPHVGATRGATPPGYVLDHNRICVGSGREVYDRAVAALRAWRMFSVGGVWLCWPDVPIAVGTTVAILAGNGRLWSLNACRIVYVIDEAGPVVRSGFAYGTLPQHAVLGEERFLIEWSQTTDEVYYDLLAVSRPRWPLRLVRPFLRRVQRRFARRSLESMRRAASG